MKKLIIFTIAISLFVGVTSCGDKTYTVTVDYSQTFKEMIHKGNYDHVNSKITQSSYPIPNELRGIKVFWKPSSFKSDKPLELLGPNEIDSLVKVANMYEKCKKDSLVKIAQEYVKRYGEEGIENFRAHHKPLNFESRRCVVYYKPKIKNLEMRIFSTLKAMKKAGFHSATAHEAMAFGSKYPEVQKRYNIFAMSSCPTEDEFEPISAPVPFVIIGKFYYPVVLMGDCNTRRLDILGFTVKNGESIERSLRLKTKNNYRFLGVKK